MAIPVGKQESKEYLTKPTLSFPLETSSHLPLLIFFGLMKIQVKSLGDESYKIKGIT